MTHAVAHGPDPVTDVDAYLASLRDALGSRDPLVVLREMPSELRHAIDGLSTESLTTPERTGKWSIRDVIQHLADSELVGGYRFRMILAHDRPTLAGYDQDLWAKRLGYAEARTVDPHLRRSRHRPFTSDRPHPSRGCGELTSIPD